MNGTSFRTKNPGSVLVVGTGALATLFAARLSATGIPVIILGTWSEGLAALLQNGAILDGLGSFPVQITGSQVDGYQAKFALVLVKSWQTQRAARQLSACLAQDGVVLTLQNGLGNDAILAGKLDWSRVARGVTTLGATLLAPGLVRQAGNGPISLEAHPRLAPFQDMLVQAGFDVQVVDDVQSLLWSKLVVSSAINPLTALLRIKNGELLSLPTARGLLGVVARETASVAGMLGVDLQFQDPVCATEEVALHTAENTSSMLQDVLRGSPTEIDAINGAIVQKAEEGGLILPVNRVLLSLVKALSVRGKI
jgi:2-dehydropantoate 2-reductase